MVLEVLEVVLKVLEVFLEVSYILRLSTGKQRDSAADSLSRQTDKQTNR